MFSRNRPRLNCKYRQKVNASIHFNQAKALSREGLSKQEAFARLRMSRTGFDKMLRREVGNVSWPIKGYEP